MSRLRNEQGFAMVLVVALGALLGILAITLIGVVQSESTRSVQSVARDAAF